MSQYQHVLVTGAAGLLGRYVVDALRRQGIRVRAFDQRRGPGDAEWIVADITDKAAVDAAVAGVDAVLHIAALANIWAGTGEEITRVNTMGTYLVFEAAQRHGVERVVFCSSDSVAGYTVREGSMVPPRYIPIDLDHPLQATDPYAVSKVIGEDIAQGFAYAGMQVVALRTVFVAYPEMDGEIRARAANPKGYRGPAVGGPSCAGGGPFYHHIDPRDLARAFCLALAMPMQAGEFERFFLASPLTLAPEKTLDRLYRLHGDSVEVRDPAYYEANPYAPLYDLSHTAERLGFVAEYDKRALIETSD